jgi:thioesterase domain-containing protein
LSDTSSPPASVEAAALLARIREQIPLTQAMQIELQCCDGRRLELRLPLAPNINDKGTAFAGSITSLGCIAGWALLTLWGEREFGNGLQVAIFDAHFEFKKPLRGDFSARVSLPPAEDCAALQQALARRGKGRASLMIEIADAEGVAVSLQAAYALWRSGEAGV